MGKKFTFILMLLIFFVSCSAFSQEIGSPDYSRHPQAKLLAQLDPVVEHTLKGYNAEKQEEYFRHFAKSMKAVCTPQVFQNVILNNWKKTIGVFKTRVLDDKNCSFNDAYPLLVYKGEFQNSRMMISVNFMKEDGQYKVMQFRIDPEK